MRLRLNEMAPFRAQADALSRQLATQALGEIDTRPDRALLLAVESNRPATSTESKSALLKTLQTSSGLVASLDLGNTSITSLAFSPDGTMLASGDGMRAVRLWTADGRALLNAPLHVISKRSDSDEFVAALAFSPDGKVLASVSNGDVVRFADIPSRQPRGPETGGPAGGDIVFSADGRLAAVGGAGPDGVPLFDVDSGRFSGNSIPGAHIDRLAVSPDGVLLAEGMSETADMKPGIELLDFSTRKPVRPRIQTPVWPIQNLIFSPNSQLLAFGNSISGISVLDVKTGRILGSPGGDIGRVSAVTFNPKSNRILWGTEDGWIHAWSIKKDTVPELAEKVAFVGKLSSLAFSPDGHTLAIGTSYGTIRIWDTAPVHEALGRMIPNRDWLNAVAFSPDGKLLAIAGDYIVEVWDAEMRSKIRAGMGTHVHSVVFSQDSSLLATAGEEGVDILNLLTGESYKVSPLPYRRGVVFTPDGQQLIFGGSEITFWSVPGRTPITVVQTERKAIFALAIESRR